MESTKEGMTKEVEPRLYWQGTEYLTTTGWTELTTDNNLIDATIKVTSSAINPGQVRVRVVSSPDGGILLSAKIFNAGDDKKELGTIPWNAGKFAVQAQAVSTAGYYTLTVRD